MRIWPFNRHRSFEQQVDLYVDGQLEPADASRFEAHLASCHRCQADIELTRLATTALGDLPEVEAPRSFRLTQAMVDGASASTAPDTAWSESTAGGRSAVATPAMAWGLRAAGGTAIAAAAVFAILVGVDLGDTGGDGMIPASSESDGADLQRFENSDDDDSAAPGGTSLEAPVADAPCENCGGELGEAGNAENSASGEPAELAPSEAGAEESVPPPSTDSDMSDGTTAAVEAPELKDSEGDDDGIDAIRIAQFGTLAVAIAAAGAFLFALRTRSTRRN